MKTKNYFFLLALFVLFSIFSTMVVAQQITSTSGYLPSSKEYYESLPLVVPTPQSLLLTLPYEVDNTTKPYFPRIDNDQDTLFFYDQHPTAACQNVATVWNTFTYEINRLRNLWSNTQETRYAPNFSHNHLNRGYQDYRGYTSLEKVQKFLMETGAMSDAEFDGPEQLESIDSWRWHSGYDYYFNAMHNKLDSVRRFDMSIPWGQNGNPEVIAKLETNLEAMKRYLYDHAQGDENNGGVITFGREFAQYGSFGYLPPQSMYSGQIVLYHKDYPNPGGHALAIVGYCDSVKYDWGGNVYWTTDSLGQPIKVIESDGIFSNDKDNNGDGVINMEDWEIGAFKVADSYGPNHRNDGCDWTLYSYMAFMMCPEGTDWWKGHEFYALTPKIYNIPEVVLKVKLDADKRNDLAIGSGYAPLANFQNLAGNPKLYTGYINAGGNLPIQGKDKEGDTIFGPIEVLFDFNHFYSEIDYGKAFLVIRQDSSSSAELNSYSLVDYRWNEEFELPYDGENITINPGTQSFGIEYHLIPHEDEITEDIVFEANRVSRFNPTLANNATMTILDDVRIDMYNSQLTINYGSMLDIGDNVVFLAKRGNNNITIKGDAIFGQNVSFIAEEGALLTISFENPEGIAELDLAYFENVSIFVSCQKLELKNSLVLHGPSNKTFVNRGGRLVIDNTTFSNSSMLPWRGIEVWGNSSLGHIPPSNQGWVQIINGGVIENAVCGIRTSKTIGQPGEEEDVYGYSGGIVQATGAIFRNNRNAVEFLPYGFANNLSFFRECQFITDAELIDAEFARLFPAFQWRSKY